MRSAKLYLRMINLIKKKGLGWDKLEVRCYHFWEYGGKNENDKEMKGGKQRDQPSREILRKEFMGFGD